MHERGRIFIPPFGELLGLRFGTEFKLIEEKGLLLLKPLISEPLRVKCGKERRERKAFLDA